MDFVTSLLSGPRATAVLAPLHLLGYSSLLGMELWHSFVVVKVCFQALPRSAFVSLQRRLFPMYFQAQTALVLLTVLSSPIPSPGSPGRTTANWVSFAVAGATAALNLLLYGPRTSKLMMDRVHLHAGSRDAGPSEGPEEAASRSPEMKRLNRSFSSAHAMSIHLNLISLGATLFYGWSLASRMKF